MKLSTVFYLIGIEMLLSSFAAVFFKFGGGGVIVGIALFVFAHCLFAAIILESMGK